MAARAASASGGVSLLDLTGDEGLEHLRNADDTLAQLIDERGELDLEARVRGRPPDPYGALLGAIVGQQLSVKAAQSIWQRLLDRFGGHTPTPEQILADDPEELRAAAEAFGGNLTATIHAEDTDTGALLPLLDVLRERAGRLLYNGWPTGVAVAWAMHHGGPYPATTASIHTSVGVTAVRRFLRPVCYQNTPQALLPEALRDDNPLGLPRRIDGVISRDAL